MIYGKSVENPGALGSAGDRGGSLGDLTYATGQPIGRHNANDPQAQMAEDAANALAESATEEKSGAAINSNLEFPIPNCGVG